MKPLTVRLCECVRVSPSTVSQLCVQFPEATRRQIEQTIGNLRHAGCIRAGKQKINRAAIYEFLTLPAPATRPKLYAGRADYAPSTRVEVTVSTVTTRPYREFKPLSRNPFINWDLCERDPRNKSRAAVHNLVR